MEQMLNKTKKDRIWELDFIRGLCVLLMIFDHFCFDLASTYSYEWFLATENPLFMKIYDLSYHYYYELELRQFVEPLVVCVFCALCGISCSFSKSNLKRGVELAICSILISIVTNALGAPINFGIFHCLTVAILLWCLINFICCKNPSKTAFLCGIIGIGIVISNYVLCQIADLNPSAFIDNSKYYFVGNFLRPDNSWINCDDQPIFPLCGYMLLGAAFGPMIYHKRKSLIPILGKYDWYAPVNFWGRIAMWVYIFHQVIITAILELVSVVLIGKFVMF